MADNGEEKLIAVARHIAKTLGQNDTTATAEDILQIYSLHRQISQYIAADHPIWSDSADATSFLDAVDELVAVARDWTPMAAEKPVAACLDRAEDLLQQAMFRLEEEFKTLMECGGESFDVNRYNKVEDSAHAASNNYLFSSEDDEERE